MWCWLVVALLYVNSVDFVFLFLLFLYGGLWYLITCLFKCWLLFGLLLHGCFWWVGGFDCGCFVCLLLFVVIWGWFDGCCLVLIIYVG